MGKKHSLENLRDCMRFRRIFSAFEALGWFRVRVVGGV